MKILLTGVAGFIGFHTCLRLLAEDHEIIGIDNINDYYEISLKEARLNQLLGHKNFSFEKIDIADDKALKQVFTQTTPQKVIHLAAQAGVRYSLKNPEAYAQSNLVGFTHILEGCRHNNIEHLIYASSSSVYGANTKIPFSVTDPVDKPVSLYGASKRANELMAYSYSHLFALPTTGLRFFTVYGPWGRPDMSYFTFTRNIIEGRPIDVYNNGHHRRDFTYIDDIVTGVISALNLNTSANIKYRLYNLGNNKPVELLHFISVLEELIGKKAEKRMLPMQEGDMESTCADIESSIEDFGFRPVTSVEAGLGKFVDWYKEYYQ